VVCRGCCAFLSEASLWRVCDLSALSGVVVVADRTPASARFLRAGAGHAGGA